jgi:quercetin dioxygenase-like cupin family protein
MILKKERTLNQHESREHIFSGHCAPMEESPPGVALRTFVSSACGARNFYTGTATFLPGAALPLHTHQVSEAVTVLEGHATVFVEGRRYRLGPLDSLHIPAFIAHSVKNDDLDSAMIAHSTFAEPQPTRAFTSQAFDVQHRGTDNLTGPEHLRRFETSEFYELADGAVFCDLFAKRFGAVGICGGYGRFLPGSSLPCHVHQFDESITIVTGEAICQVQGQEYKLSGYDTAFVPEGRAHRFFNVSEQPMAMIWVYAGDEPDRTLVDAGYCSGSISNSEDSRIG